MQVECSFPAFWEDEFVDPLYLPLWQSHDQQAGKRVPQVVRSDPPHVGGLQRPILSALYVATAEYATVGTRKDQAAVGSRRKAGKGLPHCRDHVYEPDRPIGLRRAKNSARTSLTVFGARAPD